MKKLLVGLSILLTAAPAYAASSSFADLIAAGQSVECSYSKPDGTSGTIYTAQGRLRGEMLVREGGSTYPAHMITDGQKMYMWGGPMGEKQGMVMSVNPSGAGPMGGPQTADLNAQMDCTCKPWPVDASKFDPPSDVQFQDMAAMMAQAYAGMGE